MSKWCEFGNVDSDREIVIRLGNVLDIVDYPEDITFQWLADRLRMSAVEIWAALDLPNNEGFVSALYTAKASEWGYEINEPGTPFVLPFGDDYIPPLKIAMPNEPPPHAEALRWLDDGQHSQHDWFLFWPMPRAELWLPKNIAAITYTPAIDAAQGAHSRKCISVGVGEPYVDTVSLGEAARKLREAIEAREKKTQAALSRIVLVQKMLGVVELQIRDWKHPWTRISDEEKAERVVRMAKLRKVEKALFSLLEEVVGKPENFPPENEAADELLELLAPSGTVGSQLGIFFKELEDRPTMISAAALGGVVETLTDVFQLLARSSRAEIFLRDHLLEILEQICEYPPPGFNAVVAGLNESLAYELTVGWRYFFVETRRAVGTGPSSPMAKIGTLNGLYRSLTGIAGAALHDVMVARLMVALGHASEAKLPSLMRSMSGFLLRYLSTHGWVHRGSDEVLTFGKNVEYDKVLARIMAIDPSDEIDWVHQGQFLNDDLEMQRGFLRTYGGVSIGILFSFATFAYAVSDDSRNIQARALDMAAGIAGTGEALTKAAEFAAIRRLDQPLAEALAKKAGTIGAMSAAFGLVSAGVSFWDEMGRGNSYGMWTQGLSTASSLCSIAAWASTTRLMLSFAVTGVGVVLGAAALALILLESELREGPDYLMDAYWKHVEHPESPARRFPQHLDAVENALVAARENDAFDSFHMRVGAPMSDLREKDPPTFYAAHALGFEQSEIASLFNVSPAIVKAQTGIEDPDYGEIIR